tara:strand:- start:96 stop:350 length:255 start_codon:yes stop_codon:yes gene_type:complete
MLENKPMNQNFEQDINPLEEQVIQKTLVPPPAANTLGSAKPLFDQGFAEKALAINGTEEERQTGAAGQNAPMFDINNPKYKNAL